jgi:hypothetical protein
MALKDLHSDLSNINYPYITTPMLKRGPLANVPNPDELNLSDYIKDIKDIKNSKSNNTDKTKYEDKVKNLQTTQNKTGIDVAKYKSKSLLDLYNDFINIKTTLVAQTDNKPTPNIRVFDFKTKLTSTVSVTNNSIIFGRKFSTADVTNLIKTPTKIGLDVINNIITVKKLGLDIANNIKIINKTGQDVENLIKVLDKQGVDISNNIITVKKTGIDVTNSIKVVKKTGVDITNNMAVLEKIGQTITDNTILVSKTGKDVADVTKIVKKTGIDVTNNIVIKPKSGLSVTNNMNVAEKTSDVKLTTPSKVNTNKESLFGANEFFKPVGMVARLFTDSDIAFRSSQLITQHNNTMGINATIIDNKRLNEIIDAENRGEALFINNNLIIQKKRGYELDTPFGGTSGLPYITHFPGQAWYPGNSPMSCPVQFIRGGIMRPYRVAMDVYRIGRFLASPCGLLWLALQQGAQLMNPYIERIGPIHWNRVYNPLSTIASVGGTLIGYHAQRHGFFGATPDYEKIVTTNNPKQANDIGMSRMLQMWTVMGKDQNANLQLVNPYSITQGLPNTSYTGWGGADSLYGIGITAIYTSTSGRNYKKTEYVQLQNDKANPPEPKYVSTSKMQSAKTYDNIQKYTDIVPIGTLKGRYQKARESNLVSPNKVSPNKIYINTDDNIEDSTETKYIDDFDTDNNSKNKTALKDTYQTARESTITPGIYVNTDDNIEDSKIKTYASTYKSAIAEIKDTNTKKSVGSNTENVDGFNESKSPLVNALQSSSKDENWNPTLANTGQKTGIPVFISNDENKAYNALKYHDLFDENKVKLSNNQRANIPAGVTMNVKDGTFINTPVVVEKIKWSKVADFYSTLYKKSGYKLLQDSEENNGRGLPDTGQPDNIYYPGGLDSVVHADLIDFVVCGTQFRAILNGLSYQFSPDYADIKYVGRPDPVYLYQGVTREVTFGFIVVPNSKLDMGIMWKHLNELGQKVSPQISDNKMVAPIYTLKIGNFIDYEFGFLNSLNFSVEDDYIWDIDDHKLPMYMKVDCTFKIIGKESPSKTATYFANENYFGGFKEASYNRNNKDTGKTKQRENAGKEIKKGNEKATFQKTKTASKT